jgi:hypothetical protein
MTVIAPLGAGLKTPNLQDVFPGVDALVVEELQKHPPRCILYRLRQCPIFHHPLDVEIFNRIAGGVVFVDQLMGELVKKMGIRI